MKKYNWLYNDCINLGEITDLSDVVEIIKDKIFDDNTESNP